jgi:hypothetical protein
MITPPKANSESVLGEFAAEAQSPRGAAASNARQVVVATMRCRERNRKCNLHRIMIRIRPMNEGLTVTPESLPVDASPLLEDLFPPGSSDSEKAACLLRLFKMALQPEDDV